MDVHHKPLKSRALLAIALFSLATSALSADPAPRAEAPGNWTFNDTAEVTVANLEVRVRDRRGLPVRGLERSDFRLRVEGREVPIRYFDEAAAGHVRTPLTLLFYLDNVQLSMGSRQRFLTDLEPFLKERIRLGDQVILAAFSGQTLSRWALTRYPDQVTQTLRDIAAMPTLGEDHKRWRQQALEEMHSVSDLSDVQCSYQMRSPAFAYVEELHQRTRSSMRSLDRFIKSLSVLPGRKALVYVSDGLHLNPMRDIFTMLTEICDQNEFQGSQFSSIQRGDSVHVMDRFDLGWELAGLTSDANAQGVSLYPIEASGPRTWSASHGDIQDVRIARPLGDQNLERSLQGSLRHLAADTGGLATLNTHNFSVALEELGEVLDVYYSLGFELPDVAAEKSIRVVVEGRKRSWDLSFRKSLRGRSLQQEASEHALIALLYGHAENPLAVEVESGAAEPFDTELHVVPIRLRIPLEKLSFLPDATQHNGHLTIYATAIDARQRIAPVRSAPVPIEIPLGSLEAARSQSYLYEIRMLMRPGSHRAAFCVHDDVGAVKSCVTTDLKVSHEASKISQTSGANLKSPIWTPLPDHSPTY